MSWLPKESVYRKVDNAKSNKYQERSYYSEQKQFRKYTRSNKVPTQQKK